METGTMTSKEEYKQLCETHELPLFLQDWWVHSVSAGLNWDVLFARDSENNICAVMPYVQDRRWWRNFIHMPTLCPYGGVWVREGWMDSFDATTAVAREMHAQMEKMNIAFYLQRFFPDSHMPQAFESIGYKRIERNTYVIEDTSNLQRVLDGFSKNKRKKLEKKTLTYKVGTMTAEEFYQFHVMCNGEKGKELWYTRETFLVLYEKSQARNQSAIVCIRNEHDEPLAAAFVVWDKMMSYELLNCYEHEDSDNGAREKLTFEVIRFANSLGLGIDFVSHRSYLRHYGAVKKPFVLVRRSHSALISLLFLNRRIRSIHYKKL
ncbi:MAG: hypothetical protein IJS49_06780 [Paludibacteraceae bacterium]|nr:hypothetical protein [Paludibacteraceae bacterium]